jgi:hypothetical protein
MIVQEEGGEGMRNGKNIGGWDGESPVVLPCFRPFSFLLLSVFNPQFPAPAA